MLKEFDFEDIYIRHGLDENPEPTNHPMHIHSRCEIFFFISGNVDYLVEGSRYPLLPASVMIMRPSEAHTARILNNKKYERFAINFPTSFLSQIDSQNQLMKPFLERELGKDNFYSEMELDMQLVKKIFTSMIEANTEVERRFTIHTQLGMLLFMIYEAFLRRKNQVIENQPLFSQKVIRYINEHLFEEITVTSLAEHFNLSASQFTRNFNKDVGSSPWEYILRKRLTAARELLKKGVTTQQACYDSGFTDYSSFYRSYVKYFKESPGESRRKGR
ncbi:MAG: helix-turn-helix transcriptional regulator [Treponema sp.]|nr:helix-turn-helix transcriptional regulator [Treponema sp.]